MFSKAFVLTRLLPIFKPQVQFRNAATLRDIKGRLKTVQTIKKITSSMKSVAASKLKQAEKAKDFIQPFLRSTSLLLKDIPPPPTTPDVKQVLCAVTSDRGLCGSANSNIIRYIEKITKPIPASNLEFYCIGDKSRSGMMRTYKNEVKALATNLDKKQASFMELAPFAEKIVTSPAQKVGIVSNKFINPILFEVRFQEFASKSTVMANVRKAFKGVEVEGEEKSIVSDMYDYYIHSLLYCALIENIACELSARMSSMDNATRNATEMVHKLNLDYNRKRQAGITKELTEIVSGAAAVEEGVEW